MVAFRPTKPLTRPPYGEVTLQQSLPTPDANNLRAAAAINKAQQLAETAKNHIRDLQARLAELEQRTATEPEH